MALARPCPNIYFVFALLPHAGAVCPSESPMAKLTDSNGLLRRYQAGEHEAAWAEMMALGPRVREARYANEARPVATETMRRARQAARRRAAGSERVSGELIHREAENLSHMVRFESNGRSEVSWIAFDPDLQRRRLGE